MRSQSRLNAEDIKVRMAFAIRNRSRSKRWCQTVVDLYIDLKNFPVYLSKAALVIAAQREVRGAYRARGQGLDEAYVVIRKDMKTNTGAKSIRIAGGVGKGRVRLWDAILGK